MAKYVLFILLTTGLYAVKAEAQDFPGIPKQPEAAAPKASFPDAARYKDTKLSFQLIPAPNNTFGYDIYADGRLMIHQTSVPAMPGNNGFKTRRGAEAIARLVISKIRRGEMPPTVGVDELKKLKAIP